MTQWFSSFSFAQVGALVALASLVIPIVIHLFNRSRGKIIYVGNISLIKNIQKIRVTEIKLTQYVLLLLRCLLLVLSVLILAELSRDSSFFAPSGKKILVSQNWLQFAQPTDIEALAAAQNSTQATLLADGFPTFSLNEQSLQQIKTTLASSSRAEDKLSVSSYLLALQRDNLTGAENQLYITNQAAEFADKHPSLSNDFMVHVKQLTSADLNREFGPLAPTNLWIVYDRAREIDAQFVSLALEYHASENPESMVVNRYSLEGFANQNAKQPELMPDWVILLSAQALPQAAEEFITAGGNLLSDAGADRTSEKQRIVKTGTIVSQVYKSTLPVSKGEMLETVWQDKLGRPVLIRSSLGRGELWQLTTRFHPGWSSLVESAEFPEMLGSLVSIHDHRRWLLSEKVIQQYMQDAAVSRAEIQPTRPMHQILALLLALCWLFERMLAEKNSKRAKRISDVAGSEPNTAGNQND